MYRHFLCRTHYVEKKQRAIERKVKGTEDSQLCLVCSALSPIHIPRNNFFSPLLKVWKPKWFMQPYKEQSVAPPSQLFQNPVIVFTLIFFFKLPAYSLVALEPYVSNFNSFYYCSPQLSPSSYMPPAFQSNIFGLWSLCYGALWCSETWHSAQYSNSYCS